MRGAVEEKEKERRGGKNSEIVKALCASCEGLSTSVSDAALDGLAQEVDYRAREVIQEALKFALHAKRTSLTTDDVDRAYV